MMTLQKRPYVGLSLFPLLGGLLISPAQAVEVNFKGTLIDNPPCDVYGPDGVDQPIKVDFGEVGITKIDGVNYQQDVTLTLSCSTGLGQDVQLYLARDGGMVADFDNSALQTSKSGLGVRLYYQGTVFPPNTGVLVTMSDNTTKSFPVYAVPVKDPSITLYEGPFTATATVELQYP